MALSPEGCCEDVAVAALAPGAGHGAAVPGIVPGHPLIECLVQRNRALTVAVSPRYVGQGDGLVVLGPGPLQVPTP